MSGSEAGFSVGVGATGVGCVVFMAILVDLVVLGVVLEALVAEDLAVFETVLGVVFLGALDGVAVVLARRGASPSIDLFFSIVYNYSIWVLN